MRAIGFRVKSGFAIAVVLDGSRRSPSAVARHVVELSDPDVAETRQPYHHGFYATESDARELARRVRIVKQCARRSVAALLGETGGTRATLVVGSVIDPNTVGNPHIRAHAQEGRLFRTVLEEALHAHGVDCDVIVDKQVPGRAAKDLRRPPAAIARTVMALGKSLGGPWRADEKAAATAAWLLLGEA
jgi:hypothetical protein